MALEDSLVKEPREDFAKVYKVRSSNKKNLENYKLYDTMSKSYLDIIKKITTTSNVELRYGDLVIDLSMENTLDEKKVARNGILIFNGDDLQYLDRTLNSSGTIPSNFPTFSKFPLGYWGNIFNDKIIWVQPTKDYKTLENKLITDKYKIIAPQETLEDLKSLMRGTDNIIFYVPDMKIPVLQFDSLLNKIYLHRKTNGV